MSAQVRLEALKLAVSVRGVTDPSEVVRVATDFAAFINGEVVAFKQDLSQDTPTEPDNRRQRKGRK